MEDEEDATLSGGKPSCSYAVDKDLIIPKSAYFFLFAAYACSSPFFTVIYHSWGIEETNIGIISGFTTVASTISSLVFGYISDKLDRRRLSLALCFATSCFLRALLPVFVTRVQAAHVTVFVATVMIGTQLIGGCVSTLLDNLVTLRLGPSRLPHFGKQRLWGAVSWGITSLVAGALIDRFGYSLGFYLSVVVGLFVLASLWFWDWGVNPLLVDVPLIGDSMDGQLGGEDSELPPQQGAPSINWTWHDAWFLAIVAANALCYGAVSSMLFVFLDELNGSHLLMGLSLTFTCLSEIPFMFFSGQITRKFGTHGVLLICLLSYGLRFAWYALMARHHWSPFVVLVSEPLHGITFGCFFTAMIHHATLLAPDKSSGTVKGIFSGVNALGQAAGAFSCGALVQHFDFEITWTILGIFSCSLFCLHGIYLLVNKMRSSPQDADG